MSRTLTREEGKRITRGRLLEAATRLLRERGDAGLTASAIARVAGVAQPTFYVHFRDKDEILDTLATEKIGGLRQALRDARERLRTGDGVDAIRDAYRIPLETLTSEPDLFRIYLQALHQPGSPIGERARDLATELRDDLAEDIRRLGVEASSARAGMMADAIIAMTERVGLGLVDGRYESVDEAVAVLTRFSAGLLATLPG